MLTNKNNRSPVLQPKTVAYQHSGIKAMVTKMPEIQDSKFQDTSKYATKCQKSNEIKDETAVNREIATLLLNLASRTQNTAPKAKQDVRSNPDSEAMDLSNYAKSNGVPSSMKVSSSSHSFQSPCVPSTVNPYSLLPPNLAMAGINNTSMAASLGSSYLLQNLLIGQMQQLASPQQSAKSHLMPSSQKTTQNLKSSDSYMESKTNNNILSSSLQSSINKSSNSLLSLPNVGTSSIPLLSGQIVAQLNSLLFSVHGIADKNIEMNVQGQLAAIYTRLQEIVTMITLSKKKEIKTNGKSLSDQSHSKSDLQKQLNIVTSTKEKEEQKIAKQLEEYQKALIQSKTKVINIQKNNENVFNKFSANSSVANILRNQTPVSSESLRLDIPSNKSQEEAQSPESIEYHEDGSSSPDTRRRLSRDSFPDSPPEKRSRLSQEGSSMIAVSCSTSPQSISRSKSSGKGGKGIRNRVFCGDCPGCLKNDDCGQCRYCRDKTKFGGQNRLRQKCLHRRCQMDTHRRSNGSTASHSQPQPTQSDSISTNPQIYNGVDLARFASQQHSAISDAVGGGDVTRPGTEHSIFSSLLGNVPSITGDGVRLVGPAQTHKEEDSDTHDREDSKERDAADSQQSRSDRWKAKHEAMLKLASGPTSLNDNTNSHKREMLNPEEKLARQQIFENSSLVITVNEAMAENNENIAVNKQLSSGALPPSPYTRVTVEPCRVTKLEKSQHKVKYIDRSSKAKTVDSKKEAGRLTTRSMKTVLAV